MTDVSASRALLRIVGAFRALIAAFQTRRTAIGPFGKAVRSIAVVVVFSPLLVLLRLRARLRGPFDVFATTFHGDRFRCHPPDMIDMYLWLFGVWEPDITNFVARRLPPGRGFIDVGAHTGYFSAIGARAVGERGHVVAIDASPKQFAGLRETMDLNPHCRIVRCVNSAVGAEHGTIRLFSGPSHNTGLTTTLESRGFDSSIVVPAAPLDELLTPDEVASARLLKIDIEGGEAAIISGIVKLLEQSPSDLEILIEMSPLWSQRSAAQVLQPLFDLGFHAYEINNNYWPWRYMWPCAVKPPRRSTRDLNALVKRFDLVLSRIDAREL